MVQKIINIKMQPIIVIMECYLCDLSLFMHSEPYYFLKCFFCHEITAYCRNCKSIVEKLFDKVGSFKCPCCQRITNAEEIFRREPNEPFINKNENFIEMAHTNNNFLSNPFIINDQSQMSYPNNNYSSEEAKDVLKYSVNNNGVIPNHSIESIKNTFNKTLSNPLYPNNYIKMDYSFPINIVWNKRSSQNKFTHFHLNRGSESYEKLKYGRKCLSKDKAKRSNLISVKMSKLYQTDIKTNFLNNENFSDDLFRKNKEKLSLPIKNSFNDNFGYNNNNSY